MSILILPIGVIIILVGFFSIYAFLKSDLFYNLTGRKIYYVREFSAREIKDEYYKVTGRRMLYSKDKGSRELIDSIGIPLCSITICLLILFIGYMIYSLSDYYLILYLGCFFSGLIIYFSFLICLRIKKFYYNGDKYESEKRYPISYPMVSYTWTSYLSIHTTLFYLLYITSHAQILIYGMVGLLILAHVYIFPDYMNKVLPYDLRTFKGNCLETPLIISPIMIIVILVLLY